MSGPMPEAAMRGPRGRAWAIPLAAIVVLAVGAMLVWSAGSRTDAALRLGGVASGSGRTAAQGAGTQTPAGPPTAQASGSATGSATGPATGPATGHAPGTAAVAAPGAATGTSAGADGATARATRTGTPGSVRPEPKASTASRRAETSRLRINSVPWSHVELDGKPIGVTPLKDLVVASGRHRLRLVQAEQQLEHTAEIELLARRSHVVVVDLRSRTVSERHEEMEPHEP